MSLKTILWYWGPALLMLAVIFVESTDMMSASHTGGLLLPLLQKIFPKTSLADLELIHEALRKIGHVVGYGTLSWLLFRGWAGTVAAQLGTGYRWQMRFSIFGVLSASAVAISDELHQMTIPSRGGSVHDMALDTTAAIGAQLLIAFLLRDRSRPATPVSAAD